MERTHLHILGGGSRARAEQARIAFALGHHAEVYGSLEELLERPPVEGILLAADGDVPGRVPALLAKLGQAGIWLPVVMTSEDCAIDRVVDAIRGGAIDYLPLPFEMGTFARRSAQRSRRSAAARTAATSQTTGSPSAPADRACAQRQ